MNEYRCSKCGEIFHHDEMDVRKFTDLVPYGDTNVPMDSYEYFCPYCGEEDPEEFYGERCPECGCADYDTDDGCPQCGLDYDEGEINGTS